MVEFGLKLEDNKVDEWANYYIDYEKLKGILDRLKSAMKKKDDLFKRYPDKAREIELAHEASLDESSLSLRSQKKVSGAVLEFDDFQLFADETSDHPLGGEIVDRIPSAQSERDAFLQRDVDKFGSDTSLASGEFMQSEETPLKSTLQNSLSEGLNYMTSARFETRIKDSLKQIDVEHLNFYSEFTAELQKVNGFYFMKTDELSKRLNHLIESALSSNVVGVLQLRQSTRNLRSISHLVVSQLKHMVEHQQARVRKMSLEDEHDEHPHEEDDENIAEDRLREIDSIQRALADQYRTAKLLHNFSVMNYTGFVKIAKKFDKTYPQQKGKYKEFIADANICNDSKEAEELAERMEQVYASWFCDGNIREARAQLLPKRGDGLQMDWSQLRLGYRLGMCAILTLWVCWDCIWGYLRDGNTTIGGRDAFPVFRACGGLLLLHWFWGCSVYVWTRHRINYIFLFDFDPKTVNSPIMIFNDAVDETLVFLVFMLLYYKAGAHDIPNWVPPGYFPALLVLYTVGCLIFPIRAKLPMWHTIFQVITAPLTSPSFLTIYIADVFTSMIKVFQDIAWTACFIVSGDFRKSDEVQVSSIHKWQHSFWFKNVLIPLICLFPLWIRFNQCLRKYLDTGKRMPNLANSAKYAMSQTVTLFGAFHPLYLMHQHNQISSTNLFQLFWMALFVSSSLYSFWWDVYMDWGLGDFKHGFLATPLMYPHKYYYYCVIFLDIVLRFMWVLTLVPPQSGAKFEIPQYLTAVSLSLELMRRTMWGFFRLENEHRSNTNQWRRVGFVPLHFNTGHQHKYNQGRQHVGWSVLLEVAAVTLLVVAISISSVIAAQRAARDYSGDL